jgi:hypothetical protein
MELKNLALKIEMHQNQSQKASQDQKERSQLQETIDDLQSKVSQAN